MRQDARLERELRRLSARARAYDGERFDPRRYPVLRRWEALLRAQEARAAREALARLKRDRPDLERLFGSLGALRSMRSGLSDPHDGGRTVRSLTFAGGRRLIYKPRGAANDAAYARLLRWAGLDLPVPVILDRRTHSWHEQLDPRPRRPSRRWLSDLGALAALLSAAGCVDLHFENWLSKDGRPVPADLEGLFGYGGDLRFAPLATGLLPSFRYAGPEALSEVSCGLFGLMRPRSIPVPVFRGGRLVYQKPRSEPRAELDLAPVLEGFERAARRIGTRRFPAFAGLRTRFLPRSTRDYLDWLFWSTAPDLLIGQPAQEAALNRFGFSTPERRALRRRDVPRLERPALPAPRGRLDADILARALALPSTRLKWRRGASLLAHATAIGELLGELAIETPEGPLWLDVARVRETGRTMSLRLGDRSLYSGSAGVALFLRELSKATGRSDFATLARRAEHAGPARGFIDVPRPGDPDVLNGDAGVCLTLLAQGRRSEAAALARKFAAKTPEGSGFGHGPAGTAVVFWRLGDKNRARRLLAIARERSRPGGWCSGDVGLALAEAEIEGASARPLPPLPRHHLCCGESGRILALSRLGRPKEARPAAQAIISFGFRHGAFKFKSLYERPFVPGLMNGLSGVGLALLAAVSDINFLNLVELSAPPQTASAARSSTISGKLMSDTELQRFC